MKNNIRPSGERKIKLYQMTDSRHWSMLNFFDLVERTMKSDGHTNDRSSRYQVIQASIQLRDILSFSKEDQLESLLDEEHLVIVDSLNIGRWKDSYKVLHEYGPDLDIVKFLRHRKVNEEFIKGYGDLARNFDNPEKFPDKILENNITLCSVIQLLLSSPDILNGTHSNVPQFLIIHRSDKFDLYSVQDDSNSIHYVIEVNWKLFGMKNVVNEIDDAAVIIMYEFIKRFGNIRGNRLSIMSRDSYRWWTHPYRQFILWRYGNEFEVKHQECFDEVEKFNRVDKSIARHGWV